MTDYDRCVAFIVEGMTERVFYEEYLRRFEVVFPGCAVRSIDEDEDSFEVEANGLKFLVRFNNVGTITQMPNSSAWFKRSCYDKLPSCPWTVFLCYDTDSYESRISKFQNVSWNLLRNELAACASEIVEIAASADIEDVMLVDYESVLRYLGLPLDTPIPSGKKGKARMKKLYKLRSPRMPYHEGDRARPLICSLDFAEITRRSPLPLNSIANLFGYGY